jgi:predicted flap endonuclease-1-like 5' DNA nuclease
MLRKKAERRKAEKARAREELEEQQAAEEESRKEAEREAERKVAEIEREMERKAAEIEREAAEKAAEIEREAAEKDAEAKKLLRKKAEELKRRREEGEKAKQEDREKAAARAAAMEGEIAERRSRLEELGEEERKNEMALLRVTERAKEIDFGIIGFATSDDKDDLKEIEGIGPFIEEKLNALGIYKFSQISMMDLDLEYKVNEAIEFLPGRVKRDKWVNQAKVLAGKAQEPAGEEGPVEMNLETKREAAEARALLRKKAERRRSMDMAERTLGEAQRREEGARKEAKKLLRKKAEERKRFEEEGGDIIDNL